MAFGNFEFRERIADALDFYVAALGDGHGASDRIRQFAEHLRHFLGGLEIKLVSGKFHALAVAHGLAGLNAHQDFLSVGIGLREVVAVVRGDQRDAGFFREAHEVAIDADVLLETLVLHFEEEISFAENIAQAVGAFLGLIVFFGEQRVGHFAAQAGGKRDQSFAVLGEQLVIHAGFVIEAVEISGGNELDEILVALFVFAEQHEMVRAFRAGAAIFVIVRRDVHFAADDGLYAMRRGLMVEICGGEKISVVGYGDGRHSTARGFGGEFADFASAVQKRVVRVQMKVNEVRGIHAKFILNQRGFG